MDLLNVIMVDILIKLKIKINAPKYFFANLCMKLFIEIKRHKVTISIKVIKNYIIK